MPVDVVEAGKERGERFEINHHPYRLEQSPCFRASEGAMSCLTCHDPHRKVKAAQRAAHYRAACLGCHEVDACRLEDMAGSLPPAVAADDCATCHMPKHRTQDVVQVVMTDHLIRRRPGGPELLAPRAEEDPKIDDVVLLDPERGPKGALWELYRAYTVVEFASDYAPAVEALGRLLRQVGPDEIEPRLALAKGLLKLRRFAAAEQTLSTILERAPDHPMARDLLGLVEDALGQREQAVAQILEAIRRGRDRPEARHNLGFLLTRYGRLDEALPHLERAIELRPTMGSAWFYRGIVEAGLGRGDEAVRSLRRALEIDPTHSRAYLALGQLLMGQDRRADALRTWRHGAEHAKEPERLAEALARAQREPAESR